MHTALLLPRDLDGWGEIDQIESSPNQEKELEGTEWVELAPSEVEESYLELLPERPLRLGHVLGSGIGYRILEKFGSY